MPSYYDIDTILAEEELVPCTNLFDFSHLAHLDPDLVDSDKTYLPESSQVKLPLWAMEKWAMLGFVRMSLPRHYSKKARERLEADPSEADLRYVVIPVFMRVLPPVWIIAVMLVHPWHSQRTSLVVVENEMSATLSQDA